MRAHSTILASAMTCLLCGAAHAEGSAAITVQMHVADENGIGPSAGQVVITETRYGAVFTPALTGVPAGIHGFHVHENPSCEPKEQDGKMVDALAAGGHYDPTGSQPHGLPWGDGHLGDLPALFVDSAGNANYSVLAPRLRLADTRGHALMIHAGGDNHSDHPAPLGGGGARIICGVIE